MKYDALAARFVENFKLFAKDCPPELGTAGPKRLSKDEIEELARG